ncbi:hypothetical protein CRUP_013395 [Coryphaenoides rupestris]|nr:hypothetical protein CRUP_013395 [Coryphaenoides rupestris]
MVTSSPILLHRPATPPTPPPHRRKVAKRTETYDEASTEELLRNFHKTWTESETVFMSLGYSVNEEKTSEAVRQLTESESSQADVLGTEMLTSPPELDRAHRSLAPKPAPRGKSRPVILRFHRFQIKDLVIREARRRGELIYKGHRIRFYDDYSPDVLKLRAEFKSSMAELYKRG